MKIGEMYGLSSEGQHILSLMGFVPGIDFNDSTKVTVIEEEQPCDCHSVNGRHTDDCAIRYQRVEISDTNGSTAYLSATEVRTLAESPS